MLTDCIQCTKDISMRFYQVLILLTAVFFSCEEQFGLDQHVVPQNTIDHSIQLFPGNILEKSSDFVEGIKVWKMKIENNSGAILTFYWVKNYNIPYQIEGEKGPFNYELKPPLDVIELSTAKFLAFESYSSKVLNSWKLIRDPSQNNQWIYQFFLKDEENPISVKAATGDLM